MISGLVGGITMSFLLIVMPDMLAWRKPSVLKASSTWEIAEGP